jgi:hypothetical protein
MIIISSKIFELRMNSLIGLGFGEAKNKMRS